MIDPADATRPPSPRRRARQREDHAVSELVGTLLLLGIAVVLVAGFVLVLFAVPGPSNQAHSNVQTYILPTEPNKLVLEHRGGPSIPISKLSASVTVNGAATTYVVGDNLAGSWSVISPDGTAKASTDSFSVGDRAVFTSATLQGAAVSAQLADAQVAALVVKDTPVQVADTTAPTFLNARVSGTTTITVNFTERLSTLTAGEFTVTGFTVSSATLIGNGSAAEFVVASPAWTPDQTPAVNYIGGGTTKDIAGNAFAAAATVTPVDRLAPGITVNPASSGVTTSAATITWTTNESGTSTVNYGPTPADLGISASGASGTAHSVSLSSLTDSFTYYYQVVTVDAASNTVTSSTGTFTTAAVPGGGGGGSADGAPPYHLTFNLTANVNSGLVSGTAFHVGLRDGNNQPVAPTSSLTVVLTTNSTNGWFLDSTGATVVQTVTISAGQTYAQFRYVDYKAAGYSTITGNAFNTTPDSVVVQITGNSGRNVPYHLDFSTRSMSVASGGTSSTFTISLKDQYDIAIPAPYALTIDLATNSSLGFFTSGGSIVSSVTLSAGLSSTATITYTEHRASGMSILTASTNATIPTTMVVTTTGTASSQAPVMRLELSRVPQPLTAGVLSADNFRIELRDQGNRSATPTNPVVVRLLTNSTRGYFTSTASTTPIQSVNISGASFAEFRYVDARPGVSAIMGVANGTYPAIALVGVEGRSTASEPDHLEFTATDASETAGVASSTFTLALKNGWGETVGAPGGSLTVTLSTNSSSGFFVSNADGTTIINTVTIGSGGTADFKYKDFRVGGRSVLTATALGVIPVSAGIDISGGTSGTQPPHRLSFTTVVSTVDPGINSTAFTVTLLDYQNNPVQPSTALTVNITTSSDEGVVLNSTDNQPQTSFVISPAQTTLSFKYRDNRSFGGNVTLFAIAGNILPDATKVEVRYRGRVPTAGDSESSVVVFAQAHAEETDAIAHTIGMAIVNPTPTTKTVTMVSFRANPALNGSYFANAVSLGAGSDSAFSSCATWTRTETNTNATCNPTDFTIPAWGMVQVTITFTTVSIGTDDSTVITATAYLSTLAVSDDVNIRHENTAGSGGDIEFFPTTTEFGNKLGGVSVTAGATSTIHWRIDHLQDTTNILVRITVPAGWTVNVDNTALMDHFTVAVQRPQTREPGIVTIGLGSGGAGTSDGSIPMTVKPPPNFVGVAVFRAEVNGQGVGQPLTSQLNAFPVVVT